MGYGKKGMGGAHPILKHMRPTGGGTGTKQSMSKNADIKYGGSVIDQFKSPMKNMYENNPISHATNAASNNTKHHEDLKKQGTLAEHLGPNGPKNGNTERDVSGNTRRSPSFIEKKKK